MATVTEQVLARLDTLIAEGKRASESYYLGEMASYDSRLKEEELRAFFAGAAAAVDQIAGAQSEFSRQVPEKTKGYLSSAPYLTQGALGVLIALRVAVAGGFLLSMESRIRANVGDDFLTQATDLLTSGYPAASMVLAGGVLEDRLRTLCTASSVTLTGSGSMSKYNDGLLKTNVYDQPTWRRIQSIGDLRNDAAHGGPKAAAVGAADVADAIKYIGRFLADHP